MKIGFYGGTLNPITFAHLEGAELARERLRLDKIFFIPSANPPHKSTGVIDANNRLMMVDLAITNREGFDVSTIEVLRKGKSYTQQTIEELEETYPDDELYWIIGADSLIEMPTVWKGGWGLLDMMKFVVIKRPGFDLSGCPEEILKKVIILEMDNPISSTQVREACALGLPIDGMVPKEVSAFMDERNLVFMYAANYPFELATKVVKKLKEKGLHITTVESCTGGDLIGCITSIPGASEITYGGRVTYSNEEKIRLGNEADVCLQESIATHGVYSKQTAQNMAIAGIRVAACPTEIGVGISGCFSREDPSNPGTLPGTVFVSVIDGKNTISKELTLNDKGKERRDVSREVVVHALKMILGLLERI